jgi:N-methylhydantoinase B
MTMATRLNDNVEIDGGTVRCAHCQATLAEAGEPFLRRALLRRGDISLAGPHVQPVVPPFVDQDVEFRQLLCPGCGIALQTEVAAVADTGTRTSALTP